MSELKIIQIQAMPNDPYYQGILIGLGNDGVTYCYNEGEWDVYAVAINEKLIVEKNMDKYDIQTKGEK